MGSGHWFKTLISRKKGKNDKSKEAKDVPTSENSNESESKSSAETNPSGLANGDSSGINAMTVTPREDVAIINIQSAIRARRSLHKQKGIVRLQKLTKGESVKKQSTNTLSHLHSWGRIQTQIKERRLCMVVEGRLKQKKLENQLKLEAKLHDVEVEWCNGSDTMEEILSRIHHREEAAVKRERALAYAFTHQWRANTNQNEGVNPSDLGKANWGWSWKERWIAARPWENRAAFQTNSPNKGQNKQPNKVNDTNNTNLVSSQKSLPIKPSLSNGKAPVKARKLTFSGSEAAVAEPKARVQDLVASKELTA
ncbi:hypothetical protein V2J09_017003 [Rumex salicifolius]